MSLVNSNGLALTVNGLTTITKSFDSGRGILNNEGVDMDKLFISQPMADRTDEQILEERAILKAQAEKIFGKQFELVESFFQGDESRKTPNGALYLMGKSLQKMSEAQYVVFHWDYKNYRGCRIEFQVATEYSPDCIKGILVAVDDDD